MWFAGQKFYVDIENEISLTFVNNSWPIEAKRRKTIVFNSFKCFKNVWFCAVIIVWIQKNDEADEWSCIKFWVEKKQQQQKTPKTTNDTRRKDDWQKKRETVCVDVRTEHFFIDVDDYYGSFACHRWLCLCIVSWPSFIVISSILFKACPKCTISKLILIWCRCCFVLAIVVVVFFFDFILSFNPSDFPLFLQQHSTHSLVWVSLHCIATHLLLWLVVIYYLHFIEILWNHLLLLQLSSCQKLLPLRRQQQWWWWWWRQWQWRWQVLIAVVLCVK